MVASVNAVDQNSNTEECWRNAASDNFIRQEIDTENNSRSRWSADFGGVIDLIAPVRLSRAIHLISALWTLGLAFLIFFDVVGRSLYSQPIPGTKEIIQNSIVAITFLQLPLAIYSGSMLRTTVLADAVPKMVRKVLRTLCYLLGVALFVSLIISTYEPLIDAYRIGEYEGEGALRVPVWPVRGLILVTAVFSLFAYLSMIYYDWSGKLEGETSAPGSDTSQETTDKMTARV